MPTSSNPASAAAFVMALEMSKDGSMEKLFDHGCVCVRHLRARCADIAVILVSADRDVASDVSTSDSRSGSVLNHPDSELGSTFSPENNFSSQAQRISFR